MYCILGKLCRVWFKTKKHKTNRILDYVYFDVWGPTKEVSMGDSRYFLTFTYDFKLGLSVFLEAEI